jgi:hypothetical protein
MAVHPLEKALRTRKVLSAPVPTAVCSTAAAGGTDPVKKRQAPRAIRVSSVMMKK